MEEIGKVPEIFNERVQAFITVWFYRELKGRFGTRGVQAFVQGTQSYGEQRGRRMAQRAIRAGEELTLDTYLRRGEWVNTEQIRAQGIANKAEIADAAPAYGAEAPDYIKRVTVCPWNEQFKEMKALDAGALYCRHIDPSLFRGFNPVLSYEVPQSLNGADCCYHIVRCGKEEREKAGEMPAEKRKPAKKDPAGLRSFEYHCADSYWSYRRTAERIFGTEGTAASEQVLLQVGETYGKEAAERLLQYRDTDFTYCDSREI